jgi:ABC-type amino acid transport substrate-binding protein
MRRRGLCAWTAWGSLWLVLVLGGCMAQQTATTPPTSTPAPQAGERSTTTLPVLRVGMAPNYPPIIFKEQGHFMGLEADLARGLSKELGRRIELVELAWKALIPSLEAGQIDVIMSGMSITEARERRVRFVAPYLRVGQMAIFRKADRLLFGSPSLLALTRRRVGFVAGTTGAAYVQEHLPQAQHVPLASTEEGLHALRTGTIDVFIHDAVTAWRVGSNESNNILTSSYSPLTEEYLAWAVRKTDDALYSALTSVLERWKRSGHLQELFNKWLKFQARS